MHFFSLRGEKTEAINKNALFKMGKTREDATWIFTSSIYEESITIFLLCKYDVTMVPTIQNEKDKRAYFHDEHYC